MRVYIVLRYNRDKLLYRMWRSLNIIWVGVLECVNHTHATTINDKLCYLLVRISVYQLYYSSTYSNVVNFNKDVGFVNGYLLKKQIVF